MSTTFCTDTMDEMGICIKLINVLISIPPHLRYDVALLYLQQADWDLEIAIVAYKDDERWEKEHPLEAKQKVKNGKKAKDVGMRRFVGGR